MQHQEDYWHSLIYRSLRDQPLPFLVFSDTMVPAATMWAGMRVWVDYFRQHNVNAGAWVIIALPACPAFLYALLAGMWQGLTVVVYPTSFYELKNGLASWKEKLNDTLTLFPGALLISDAIPTAHITVDIHGLPVEKNKISDNSDNTEFAGFYLHKQTKFSETMPDRLFATGFRLVMRTSGSSGNAKWVILSDHSIRSVLTSHQPYIYAETGKRVLSVLPWGHVFGLIIDLFPALFSQAEIVRDIEEGKSIDHILYLADLYDINFFSSVPLLFDRLMQNPQGEKFIYQLSGGVVGGAPVWAKLGRKLHQTNLRIGYGQTEASPGITLGEKGVFEPGYMGKAVGCEARLNQHGELEFRGDNLALGYWQKEGFVPLPFQNGWLPTGDLVKRRGEHYYYLGRKDANIKMPNGRFIFCPQWEYVLKQQFSEFDDVLLMSNEEYKINVYLFLRDDFVKQTEDKSLNTHRADYYSIITRILPFAINEIVVVPSQIIRRQGKGDIDRQATWEEIKHREQMLYINE